MKYKVPFTIFLLIALGVAVRAGEKSDTAAKKGFRVYRNDKYGFEFQYPEQMWQFKEKTSNTEILVHLLYRPKDWETFGKNESFETGGPHFFREVLLSVSASKRPTYKTCNPYGKELDYVNWKSEIINGREFRVYGPEADGDAGGRFIHYVSYFTIVNGVCFELTSSRGSHRGEDKVVKEALDSFYQKAVNAIHSVRFY
jgi:hypothetical protein